MNFYCGRCSRIFASKQSLQRHMVRKKSCIGVEFNQNIESSQPKVNILAKKSKPKVNMLTLKSKHFENTNDSELNDTEKFSCEFCGKIFTYKQSKYRHVRNCKPKHENDKKRKIQELEEKIKILQNQIKELKPYEQENNYKYSQFSKKSNCTNNLNIKNQIINNNYNIQNNNLYNVTINGFGKENLKSITKKEIIDILNKRFEAFPAALERIYTIPENQNFYLPNKRDKKYIKVFDGRKVSYEDSNDFVYKLSNKIMEQLESWFESHNKDIKYHRRKLMKNIFTIFNDGQLYDRYKKEIDKFLMTYSNSIKSVFENNIQNIRKQINIIENSL